MYARARYKYPVKRTAEGATMDSLEALEASVFRDEDPPFNAPMVTAGASDTTCMVCGLSSDPFLVLLCDGCENEAHLACVGLSHVPEGKWFCSSCHPHGHYRSKAAHPTKPASQSHDIRRQAGELDEIDGIMIEAFADDDAEFRSGHEYQGTSQLQPQPQQQPRPRPRPRKRSQSRSRRRSRPRSEEASQLQSRPFRHQLLFSSPRVHDGGSNSSMQTHGLAVT